MDARLLHPFVNISHEKIKLSDKLSPQSNFLFNINFEILPVNTYSSAGHDPECLDHCPPP